MKCPEANVWLLTVETPESLPPDVAHHLAGCRRCRRRRQRLLRLNQVVQEAPLGPVAPGVRDRLLRRLERLPRPAPRRRWGWHVPAAAAAALVLLALGLLWLLKPGGHPPGGALPEAAGPRADEPLVLRFLERDLRLAETFAPAEQLAVVTDMAADLRAEAFRVARQGPLEDLPLMAGLYDRVVRQGVVGRARALPEPQGQVLVPPVLRQLQETEAEVEHAAAELPPAVADYLRPMGRAARDASASIQAAPPPEDGAEPEPPTPLPAALGASRALLAALVVQGLRLAEEDDPLRRADSCSDVADQLLQTIQLSSARGDVEHAARLGKHLGPLLDRGVTGSLARLRQENPDDPRLAELDQSLRRAAQEIQALESSLADQPATGPPGDRHALEAARRERVKELDKMLKDVDKSLKKIDHDKPVPPGLRDRPDKGPPKGRPGGPPHPGKKPPGPPGGPRKPDDKDPDG